MKIFRAKEMKVEPREGFALGFLAEINLEKRPGSVGFFLPAVPPNGKLRNHYHEEILEFMVFPKPARIRCGKETYDLEAGDMVMLPPGEVHEVLAGPEGVTPIVVKLPNNPKDTKVP